MQSAASALTENKVIKLVSRVKEANPVDRATQEPKYPSGPPMHLLEDATASAKELRWIIMREREHVEALIKSADEDVGPEEYDSEEEYMEGMGESKRLHPGVDHFHDTEGEDSDAGPNRISFATAAEGRARKKALLEDLRPQLQRESFDMMIKSKLPEYLRDGLMFYGTTLVSRMQQTPIQSLAPGATVTAAAAEREVTERRHSKAALNYTKEYLRLLGVLTFPPIEGSGLALKESEQVHHIRQALTVDRFFQFLVDVISPLLVKRGTMGSLPDADIVVIELIMSLVQNLTKGPPKVIEPLIGVLCRTDCLAFIILIVQQNCHIRVNITQKEEQLLLAREAQRNAVSAAHGPGGYNKLKSKSKSVAVGEDDSTPSRIRTPLEALVGTPSRKVPLSPVPPKGLSTPSNKEVPLDSPGQTSGMKALLNRSPQRERGLSGGSHSPGKHRSESPGQSSAAGSHATAQTGMTMDSAHGTVVSQALANKVIASARKPMGTTLVDDEDELDISDVVNFGSLLPGGGDSPHDISNTLQEEAVPSSLTSSVAVPGGVEVVGATLVVDGTSTGNLEAGGSTPMAAPGTPVKRSSLPGAAPRSPPARQILQETQAPMTPPSFKVDAEKGEMVMPSTPKQHPEEGEGGDSEDEEEEELVIEDPVTTSDDEDEHSEVVDPKSELRRMALELAEENAESRHQLGILRKWNWMTLDIITLVFRSLTSDQLQLLTGQSLGASSHRVTERLHSAFGEAFREHEQWKRSAKQHAGATASATLVIRKNVKRPRDIENPNADPDLGEEIGADGLTNNESVIVRSSAAFAKHNKGSSLQAAKEMDSRKKMTFSRKALVHPMDISTMPLATQMQLVRHYTTFLNAGFEELAEMLWPEVKKKMQQTIEELNGIKESKGGAAALMGDTAAAELAEFQDSETTALSPSHMQDIFNYMQLCSKLLFFTRQIVLSVRGFIAQTQARRNAPGQDPNAPLDIGTEYMQSQMLQILQLHSKSVFGLLTTEHFGMGFALLADINTNTKMRRAFGTNTILGYLSELTYLLWHTARGDLSADTAVTGAAEHLACSILSRESKHCVRGVFDLISRNIKSQGASQMTLERHLLYSHAMIQLLSHCSFNGEELPEGWTMSGIVKSFSTEGLDLIRLSLKNWRINTNHVNLALADLMNMMRQPTYRQHYAYFNVHFLMALNDVLTGLGPEILEPEADTAPTAGGAAPPTQQQPDDQNGLKQLYLVCDAYAKDFFTPAQGEATIEADEWRTDIGLRCVRATVCLGSGDFLGLDLSTGMASDNTYEGAMQRVVAKKPWRNNRKKHESDESEDFDARLRAHDDDDEELYNDGSSFDGGVDSQADELDRIADEDEARTRQMAKDRKKNKKSKKSKKSRKSKHNDDSGSEAEGDTEGEEKHSKKRKSKKEKKHKSDHVQERVDLNELRAIEQETAGVVAQAEDAALHKAAKAARKEAKREKKQAKLARRAAKAERKKRDRDGDGLPTEGEGDDDESDAGSE